jgi:hemoglobin
MKEVQTGTATLYERLGKEEEITRIVDEVVEEHMKNPGVNARFLPYLDNPGALKQIKEHTVAFFSAGSGGPQVYQGRSMPVVHRGMNINASEYMMVMDDILTVLERHGKDEQTRKDVLAILYSLKDTIIGK